MEPAQKKRREKKSAPLRGAEIPAPPTEDRAAVKGKAEAQDADGVEYETRRRKGGVQPKREDQSGEEDADDFLPEAKPAHPRNEVDPKATQRQNAVYIYGLDFLKTSHLDEIFSQFDHKFIEWLNDSAANIIFAQPINSKKAMDALSVPKVGDEPWRRTPDILVSEGMPPIFLQMRLATTADVKPSKKAMPKISGYVNDRRRAGSDRVVTTRPKPAVTDEEAARRRKRATRFADWLKATPKPVEDGVQGSENKSNSQSLNAGSKRPATTPIESEGVTESELQKRRRREERFAEDKRKSGVATEPADNKGKGADRLPPLEGSMVADREQDSLRRVDGKVPEVEDPIVPAASEKAVEASSKVIEAPSAGVAN